MVKELDPVYGVVVEKKYGRPPTTSELERFCNIVKKLMARKKDEKFLDDMLRLLSSPF